MAVFLVQFANIANVVVCCCVLLDNVSCAF